jgi:hypothetical protein
MNSSSIVILASSVEGFQPSKSFLTKRNKRWTAPTRADTEEREVLQKVSYTVERQ